MQTGNDKGRRLILTELFSLLSKIKKIDDDLGAISCLANESQLEYFFKSINDKGPLFGRTFIVKDNIDLFGFATTNGSLAYRNDEVKSFSSPIITRLIDLGAIPIGKSKMHELAIGHPSLASAIPPTRNPWNTRHHPGGSSSGSAAAVAAGYVPFALGTDTLGSIRGPAGLCGVLGLKLSYNPFFNFGVTPLAPSLDHLGLIAKNSKELKLIYESLLWKYSEDEILADASQLRVGYLNNWREEDINDEHNIESSLTEILSLFRSKGGKIRYIKIPKLNYFKFVCQTIQRYETWRIYSDLLQDNPNSIEELTKERILSGENITTKDYLEAKKSQKYLKEWLDNIFRTVDVLIAPNALDPAPSFYDEKGLQNAFARQYRTLFNLSGHPALSVPIKLAANGLPLSMQVVGPLYKERNLILFSQWVECNYFKPTHPLLTENQVRGLL